MDAMEDLVINASSESSEYSGKSSSGFSWPFSNFMGKNDASDSPDKISAKSPRKKSGQKSVRNKNRNVPTHRNPNITPLVDEKFTVDRYHHDVEQAKLMRGAMDRRKQNKKQQIQQRDRKEPTESEIRLALDGLDEAVVLRRMGQTKDALKISELSIELLIGYLKSDPKTIDIPGLSRDVVGIRINNALTLAEEMKSEVERISRKTGASVTSNRQPKQKAPQIKTIANSISKIIDSANEDKIPSPSAIIQSTTKRVQNTMNKQAPNLRTSSKRTNSTTNRKNTGTQKPVSVTAKSSAGRKNVATAAPSPFANSQDPLVKTIKSDLYIDPSKLHSTTWNDIAGLADAKQALQEAAILPLMRPDLFSGLRRPRNILLYGPPGTGKTLLVKAVAHESSCVLFVCTASAMTSKWHGEGEKLLRTLFQVARAAAPSIIFVDEMDALLSSRKSDGEHEASRRFKTEFMTSMDGIVKNGGDENGKHLLVIAATNCPWDIDSAVLRRFPRRIYVPLPDSITRTALLQSLLDKAGDTYMSKADIKAVVKRLDGFSGSDIASIASEASFGPIRSLGGIDAIQAAKSSDIRPIQRQDFDKAIDQATKSVSKTLLKQYDQWKQDQAAS